MHKMLKTKQKSANNPAKIPRNFNATVREVVEEKLNYKCKVFFFFFQWESKLLQLASEQTGDQWL